jgi:hypothetical protein
MQSVEADMLSCAKQTPGICGQIGADQHCLFSNCGSIGSREDDQNLTGQKPIHKPVRASGLSSNVLWMIAPGELP